ncbi:DUF1801 domain-containing protein [Candidatus Saccharibacteria bacterium]|nr:DUF1801 domain-containing protein [Candidatus Saccharibacteria bacterium]
MNSSTKSSAKTPADYINQLEEPRKSEIAELNNLIRATVPKLKPFMQSGMLAYGKYRFRYASGREGDWMVIGLASQKNYISLYICCILADTGQYLAEQYKDKLPKASIGKSCIRFKHLGDADEQVIKEILKKAEKLGGMSAV